MLDSTSAIKITKYILATDLYNTLLQDVNKIDQYAENNIDIINELITSCQDSTGDVYDEDEVSLLISSFSDNFESYIPSIEVNPSEDNTFFNELKSYYSSLDFSGVNTLALKFFDVSGEEFNQNFLFYSSSEMITGSIANTLTDFNHDDFTIAAYISGISHNVSVSKLEPIISNATNINNMLIENFDDIISISDASAAIDTMNVNLDNLYINSNGIFEYDNILNYLDNSSRIDNIKEIISIYDMYFNILYGQIISMSYSLSDKNYKLDLNTLKSIKPLP